MDDNVSEAAPDVRGLDAMQTHALDHASPLVTRAMRWLPIAAVFALAGFLYCARLSQNGYANQYYSAAVVSMTQGWKNFFFGSFDPAGFITVDKPPAALWVQAASARLFGVNSWSILLPQALAGLLTVALMWDIVRRRFGELAGVVTALVLATTPIFAATARVNLPDVPLALVLVASAWTGLRATEQGSLRWSITTAALIGLAFNIKMLQAYLVLPAFVCTYFVCAPVGIRTRLLHLTAAMVVMVVVSSSWAAIVDIVPADSRPYIGGSTDNTARDLIFGYNGLERITGGNSPFPGGGPPPGGFLGVNFGGAPGWTRLFNDVVAGQVAWLVPLAAAGFVVGIVSRGLAPRTDPRRASVIYWGAWAAIHFVVFSKAEGIFHPYYTAALAPGLAALAGIAAAIFVAWARRPSIWLWGALAVAIATTAALQVYLLRREPPWNEWLEPTVIAGTAAVLIAMTLGTILTASGLQRAALIASASALVGFAVLLLTPLTWSVSVLDAELNGVQPQAGPAALAPGSIVNMGVTAKPQLATFLEEERGEARFLMATFGALEAAPYVVSTREPVLAVGGFAGTDPAPTLTNFKEMIEAGRVRFVMFGGIGLIFQQEIGTYVRDSCAEVAPDLYADSHRRPAVGGPNAATQARNAPGGGLAGALYDCA